MMRQRKQKQKSNGIVYPLQITIDAEYAHISLAIFIHIICIQFVSHLFELKNRTEISVYKKKKKTYTLKFSVKVS